ncbi:MAG: IS1380 family transposase [Candidatus Marinimicrobia bacterium]|nr:IS1380 family transposase [Candidatus Neomarinimicrobiota bacterium]MCH7764699.1 IS1380 family transposase [Candidatus Neomarinimicrobiota bacterium]
MQTIEKNLHRQNDTNQSILSQISLPIQLTGRPVCGKNVAIDFNGGNVTSDAGVLLLSEIENQIGLIDSLSACIQDSRRSYSVDHSINDLFAQRIYQISCGYEDANDSNSLRKDPALKMALDRLPVQEDDLASQPTISRLENQVTEKELAKMKDVFINQFISSYDKEPELIVLEFDDTNHTVHGQQQESLFNGYYGEYCFMPLHVYEGISGKFITAILRPGKRSAGKETEGHLKSIVKQIRAHWPNTIIVFRGDGHFSSPEVFDYIESQENMYSITGLTGNNVLQKQAQTTIDSAKRLYKDTQRKIKLYHSFFYQAGSWDCKRRVVVKVEMSERGLNVRYISTDMYQAKTRSLYEDIYCARGNMELMIKDHKTYTKSDRTSCHSFHANQFRLFLHSAAYVLLHHLRTQVLKGTELSKATFETLRLRLLKIGGRVVELKTKIKIHLPNAYPYKFILKKCFDIFDHLRRTDTIRLC